MDHQRLASQNLLSRMNSTKNKCLDIKFSDNFPYSFLYHPMPKLQTKGIKLDLRLLLKSFISEFKFRTKPGLYRKLSVAGRLGRGEKRGEGRSGGERKEDILGERSSRLFL